MDELDAIAPTRKDGGEDLSQRMVAALLALIDGVNKNHRILVIAATKCHESVDPALRPPTTSASNVDGIDVSLFSGQ